jgi:CheY-like chemotaxis protein
VDPKASATLVMVVDGSDEADDITGALEQDGYRVVRATSVIEAESLFVTTRTGAIVLGFEENGALGFCDLVRAIPRFGGVPLIAVGRSDDSYQAAKEALLHGADAYLRRSTDIAELPRQLGALLGNRSSESAVQAQASAPGDAGRTELRGDRVNEPTAEAADTSDASSGGPYVPEMDSAQLPAAPGGTREPTQVLEDHGVGLALGASPVDSLSWSGGAAGEDLGTGGDLPGHEHVPWEASAHLVRSFEEDAGDLDHQPPTSGDTDLPTVERPIVHRAREPLGVEDDPTEDVEVPWSLPTALSTFRPGTNEGSPRTEPIAPFPSHEEISSAGPDSDLSAEFRRVIDAVALRLFPEASPDEYRDEPFEEVKTVVPHVGRAPVSYDDEDLQDYDFDAMATFASGHSGITLSGFAETADEVESPTRDPVGESSTRDAPTQWRPQDPELDAPDETPPVVDARTRPREDASDGLHMLAEVLEKSCTDRSQMLALLHGLMRHAGLPTSPAEQVRADRAADRARLELWIRLAREADYFTLLGVAPEASPLEVQRAYERARVELAPERLARIGATDLDERLSDARYVVQEAVEVLSDDELSRAYRQGRFGHG